MLEAEDMYLVPVVYVGDVKSIATIWQLESQAGSRMVLMLAAVSSHSKRAADRNVGSVAWFWCQPLFCHPPRVANHLHFPFLKHFLEQAHLNF